MKRFYKDVAARPVSGGYAIELDGRPIKTPARVPLIVPAEALAQAIADEWAGQGDEVVPQSMALTGMANTALDLTEARRADVINTVTGYAETDLLCYRAEGPEALRTLQDERWQPLLEWGAEWLDAPFKVTSGILHVAQDAGVGAVARAYLEGLDGFGLIGAGRLIQGMGSFILGLAVVEGRISAPEAFSLSHLDEEWQEAQWGADAEAAARRDLLRQDIEAAADFLHLCRK